MSSACSLMFLARGMLRVIGAGIVMMSGFMLGVAAISATVRNPTPPDRAGAGPGPADDFAVLVPMVVGPFIGAAVIIGADETYVDLGVVQAGADAVDLPGRRRRGGVHRDPRVLRCAARRRPRPRDLLESRRVITDPGARPSTPTTSCPSTRVPSSSATPTSTSTAAGTTPSPPPTGSPTRPRELGRRDRRAVLTGGAAVGRGPDAAAGRALWYRRPSRLPAGFARRSRAAALRRGRPGLPCAVDGARGRRARRRLPAVHRSTSPTPLAAATSTSSSVRVRDVTDTSWRARGKQTLDARRDLVHAAVRDLADRVARVGPGDGGSTRLVLTPHLDAGEVEVTVVDGRAAPARSSARRQIGRRTGAVVGQRGPVGVPTRIAAGGPRACLVARRTRSSTTSRSRSATTGSTSYFGHAVVRRRAATSTGVPGCCSTASRTCTSACSTRATGPTGCYTAPSDEALVHDIATAKELGFTMLRKHIKIEPLRWYHHCDRLGHARLAGHGQRRPAATSRRRHRRRRRSRRSGSSDRRHALFGRAGRRGRARVPARSSTQTVELLRVASRASRCGCRSTRAGGSSTPLASPRGSARSTPPGRSTTPAAGTTRAAGDLASRHVYFRPLPAVRAPTPTTRVPRCCPSTAATRYRVAGHTLERQGVRLPKVRRPGTFERAFLRLQHAQVAPGRRPMGWRPSSTRSSPTSRTRPTA